MISEQNETITRIRVDEKHKTIYIIGYPYIGIGD